MAKIIIKPILPFDANEDMVIKFQYDDSLPAVGGMNRAVVYYNGKVLYEAAQVNGKYYCEHVIPGGSLSNYILQYKIQVFLYANADDEEPVAESDLYSFWCLAAPSFEVLNLSSTETNIVSDSTLTLSIEYTQAELSYASAYRVDLYDISEDCIFSSGEVEKRIYAGDTFEYTLTGLQDGHVYSVDISGYTGEGVEFSTGKIKFGVSLSSSELIVTADKKRGSVSVIINDLTDLWGDFELSTVILRKREKGDLHWTMLYELPYGEKLIIVDNACRNKTTYEYSLVPVHIYIDIWNSISSEVYVEFGGMCISDPDGRCISTNYDVGMSSSINFPATPTSTFGRKYPYVIQANDNQYYSGNATGTFIQLEVSEQPKKNNWKYIDSIMKFLSNKKTKILRDELGRMFLIKVVGVPAVENSEHQDKTVISFEWVEVGDATSGEQLRDEGFYGGW